MNEPCEVSDEEHEQIVARVAAVDVAKASGMVCTRVPHDTKPGRRLSKVWNVAATTNAITELADHLVCQGIERIVLESTDVIWRRRQRSRHRRRSGRCGDLRKSSSDGRLGVSFALQGPVCRR